uniref:hypothetical protein n=1 Tax=Sahlingia subintegra TaxID=468936 RepID=UPI001FCD3D28|nr:hypothetical protein MW427_mgp17 [Sahlingia subintegra]UNJ19068.1 hypothetical protein [Sahlingia subintegra]
MLKPKVSRLFIYHKNIISFDELTKFNVSHPLRLKNWISGLYFTKLQTIESNNYFYLLLVEWLFSQQIYILQNKKNGFTLKVTLSKKNVYRLLDYLLIFNILSNNCTMEESFNDYIFYLPNIWSPIFDTFCKLNLDYDLVDKNYKLKSNIILKIKKLV